MAAFPRMDCLLAYADGTGVMQRLLVAGWESGQVIDCAKEGNAPVLAYPMLPSEGDPGTPGMLRPAGGIFPGSAFDQQGAPAIELTWADGAVARVSGELRSAGLDTSLFNFTRLAGEMRERQDPWDLDLESMVQEIVSGEFDIYDVDPLPCRDVRLAVGTGAWVMESPFRAPAASDAGGILSLDAVSEGMHALYAADGRVVKIDVRGTEVISTPVTPR
jgi:hypothetical protein